MTFIIVENTCQGTQRESCNRLYSLDSDYDECCIYVIVHVIVSIMVSSVQWTYNDTHNNHSKYTWSKQK